MGIKTFCQAKVFGVIPHLSQIRIACFYHGGSIYLGKISVNGEYIAPNDLDCAVDSFPGVWDIARKMKIIFPRDKDDAVIDSKCRQLFSGEKTLDELGESLSI